MILIGCQDYSSSFEVLRNPRIRADIDGERWTTERYLVQNLGQTLYFDDSLHRDGTLFYRVLIVGLDPNNSDLKQFQLTLDVRDPERLVNTYTTRYTESGGIYQMEWIAEGESRGTFRLYTLCPDEAGFTRLDVERQNRNEQIFAGTFQAILCRRDAPNARLTFLDGSFRDLSYE